MEELLWLKLDWNAWRIEGMKWLKWCYWRKEAKDVVREVASGTYEGEVIKAPGGQG